jgi:hypothetical protein
VAVAIGWGVIRYATHAWPSPTLGTVAVIVAIPLALLTAIAVTLARVAHLLRAALDSTVSHIVQMLFTSRPRHGREENPPTLWN